MLAVSLTQGTVLSTELSLEQRLLKETKILNLTRPLGQTPPRVKEGSGLRT